MRAKTPIVTIRRRVGNSYQDESINTRIACTTKVMAVMCQITSQASIRHLHILQPCSFSRGMIHSDIHFFNCIKKQRLCPINHASNFRIVFTCETYHMRRHLIPLSYDAHVLVTPWRGRRRNLESMRPARSAGGGIGDCNIDG